MLYNLTTKKIKTAVDCITCPYFNKTYKKCEGLDKNCLLYDEKTDTIIDGVTKLPLKIKKGDRL